MPGSTAATLRIAPPPHTMKVAAASPPRRAGRAPRPPRGRAAAAAGGFRPPRASGGGDGAGKVEAEGEKEAEGRVPFPVRSLAEAPACPGGEKCECDGTGRIAGGIGAVVGFGWWPIKAYRPCPALAASGRQYVRKGQVTDEIFLGSKPPGTRR